MDQIPIEEALFCINCNTIFRMGAGRSDCPHCAGRQIVPLDRWLSPYRKFTGIKAPARVEAPPVAEG